MSLSTFRLRTVFAFFTSAIPLCQKVLAQDMPFTFSSCEQKVLSIMNGTYTDGGINNETIWQYIYTGPVHGLKPSCPRSQILTLTMEGCKVLCGDNIEITEPTKALSLIATWLFPLAILLNLPYESYHSRKVRKTLESVSNWLGSPQSALTATLWNFRQIRDCHRRSKDGDLNRELSDAYYVLSSMNQFDIGGDPGEEFCQTLIYGLFRPTAQVSPVVIAGNGGRPPPDIALTRQLLSTLAFQLRMLRRRGVIPTLSSLATFLVAFVFSVVLAFGNFGDHTDILALSLGLVVMWLPLLVIFTIVDRNPVSSERTSELISRWLWNVQAVKNWAEAASLNPNPSAAEEIIWWTPSVISKRQFPIGDFIGQGRRMQYCGLVNATMSTVTAEPDQFDNNITTYNECGNDVSKALRGHKPRSWYMTAIVSFLLVWTPIMMAVMLAFNTPTVGSGCWSGSCFMFGALSSVAWLIQFHKRPPGWAMVIAHTFNAIAVLWLLATIFLQITGAFNNCSCLSAPLAYPAYGGYMDFGTAEIYREMYDVVKYWAAAAVVGGLVPIVAFVTAVFWWLKCQHLWSANEHVSRGVHVGMEQVHACLKWLQK